MPSFEEHIEQARKNLSFLQEANNSTRDSYDWQITVCFYTALHLINAHLVYTTGHHFRTHFDVNKAINPKGSFIKTRLMDDDYVAYKALQNLSRRARYLVSDNPSDREGGAYLVSEKYLMKAVRNLDKLLVFMNRDYGIEFGKMKIKCAGLEKDKLDYFDII